MVTNGKHEWQRRSFGVSSPVDFATQQEHCNDTSDDKWFTKGNTTRPL